MRPHNLAILRGKPLQRTQLVVLKVGRCFGDGAILRYLPKALSHMFIDYFDAQRKRSSSSSIRSACEDRLSLAMPATEARLL